MQDIWKHSYVNNKPKHIPRNRTGIYASDICGMAVSSDKKYDDISQNSQTTKVISSPLGTINSAAYYTRQNSAYYKNQYPSRFSENRFETPTIESTSTFVLSAVDSKKQNNREFYKNYSKLTPSSPSTKKSSRLVPAETKAEIEEIEKRTEEEKQAYIKSGFRPSLVFRNTTKFLKSASIRNQSGLSQKTIYYTDSAKKQSNTKPVYSDNEADDEENFEYKSSFYNFKSDKPSLFLTETNYVPGTPCETRSRLSNNSKLDNKSISSPFQNKTTNSFFPSPVQKSSLLGDILKGNNSKETAEKEKILSNLTETQFLDLLKKYRETKDLGMFLRMRKNNDDEDLSDEEPVKAVKNSNKSPELRLPAQNNIEFNGVNQTSYQINSLKYIDDDEGLTPAPISEIITPIQNKKYSNQPFFVNYINNKYEMKRYKAIMNVIMNSQNDSKENREKSASGGMNLPTAGKDRFNLFNITTISN